MPLNNSQLIVLPQVLSGVALVPEFLTLPIQVSPLFLSNKLVVLLTGGHPRIEDWILHAPPLS